MLNHMELDTKVIDNEAVARDETMLPADLCDRAIPESFDELMCSFEAFKETNDLRLEELEKSGTTDVITVEKLDRINHSLDDQQMRIGELTKKSQLDPQRSDQSTNEQIAHKAAFENYIRKGEEGILQDLESKALSVGSDSDGGFLAPEELEQVIDRSLTTLSPIRAIASVRKISASLYKRPFVISGAGTGWVGETSTRPETGTPQLAELTFPTMELYAMPAATMTLLEDSAVDINEWLAEEVQAAFASEEGVAFVNGDGINKPKGFLAYPVVDNTAWSWGSLGSIASGADGDFAATDPADSLIELIYSLQSGYRVNSRFVMNRMTHAEVRKLKDGQGNYLWQPSSGTINAPSLLGYPITEAEEMPDITSASLSIAFGDFKRGYLVVDRRGTLILRDRYSAKPYVLFYTTRRVGGGVQDFNAIKFLKFSI